jgi:hypothetical protein
MSSGILWRGMLPGSRWDSSTGGAGHKRNFLLCRKPPFNVVMIACTRRLLVILNALLKNNVAWDAKPQT